MSNRLQTQDRLIAATRELIMTEGVEHCSLERICTKAGFTRGAFYSNFASKDSLLAAMAEEEYANLIDTLEEQMQQWQSRHIDGDTRTVMQVLLFDFLDAIGVQGNVYTLHSELMMRAVRDTDWAQRLLEINNEFNEALARCMETILAASGRTPTIPMRPLTHAVIGIAMRAAGVESWRRSASALPLVSSAADSPVRDILETILILLMAASEPQEIAPAEPQEK
ncbi:TetR/AcrR family transcriptional regulator [Gleimia hominis]|uniref:TetR/AcrR family transcriptional regulator n=1 Tax=Gleimia hominis TaxID=595468 RepID=A0ABU3I9B0_9ACTO|nr:TetR/AcrR family transcriptional regulator [Gleimia hominis]MDT3766959.1 TetR/AcrR family transcriptional regulator [Gleimia hominis]